MLKGWSVRDSCLPGVADIIVSMPRDASAKLPFNIFICPS